MVNTCFDRFFSFDRSGLSTRFLGPRIPSRVPLVAFPRGRAASLFEPVKQAMKAHGMLRPADEFCKRTGAYNRVQDLASLVPDRYRNVMDGRKGPIQDAEVEVEKILNATTGGQ